jgi:NADPH-dependent 7-cyano-7-deazaguanine reductase QueF
MTILPSGPERRRHLETPGNPAPGRDYMVALQGALADGRSVSVSYVPDRAVVDPGSFGRYLAAIEQLPWESLEQLGAALLDDVANALVPRWARVELSMQSSGGLHHRVRLEERQPHWRNDALVSGLA